MNHSTHRILLTCLTTAQFLLFSAVARLAADEPRSADTKLASDQKATAATIRLDGLLLNLGEGEAQPQAEAAGLTFTLNNAVETAPRFWIGIALASPDETLRLHLGIAPGTGLIVNSVESDSPAAKAGVMLNDLLLKLDGKPVTSVEELSAQIQQIGEKSVTLELLRRGKPATLTVSPEKRAAQGLVVLFDNLESIPGLTFTAEPMTISFDIDGDGVVLGREPPDLAKQVGELLEQVRQLQKSLEALETAVKAQAKSPGDASPKK